MGEFDGALEMLAPMLGISPEALEELKKAEAARAEKERVKYNMLVRIYKWVQKHDPQAFAEVKADAAKAKEGQ